MIQDHDGSPVIELVSTNLSGFLEFSSFLLTHPQALWLWCSSAPKRKIHGSIIRRNHLHPTTAIRTLHTAATPLTAKLQDGLVRISASPKNSERVEARPSGALDASGSLAACRRCLLCIGRPESILNYAGMKERFHCSVLAAVHEIKKRGNDRKKYADADSRIA